jgi:multiple sugar transport system ATP-binding protein
MNLVRGELTPGAGGLEFSRAAFRLRLPLPAMPVPEVPRQVFLGLRPESLRVVPMDSAPLAGKVTLVEPRGPEAVVTVETWSTPLKVLVPARQSPSEGQIVGRDFDPAALVFFNSDTSARVELY